MTKLTFHQLGIDTYGKTSGQIKTFCPFCHGDRKKNTHDKSLSVNIDMGTYNCHHCGRSGGLNYATTTAEYIRPAANFVELSDEAKLWFKSRGISEETAIQFRIFESFEWMPEGEYNGKKIDMGRRRSINFTYYRDNELINIKYRDGLKNFRLVKGAELIFYNLDAIKGKDECLICEGEVDCLSFHQAGYKTCISVPNGANLKGDAKLLYLDNCWEHFEDKEKILIATDNDEAGMTLKRELIRRLGAHRCFTVNLEDCKDGNEYLQKYGEAKLLDRVKNPDPVPAKGIWKAEGFKEKIYNLYKYGREKPATVHLGNFDKLMSFRKGDFTIVTGIPTHGKTEFTLYLMVLLSSFYGWKWVVFCPENMPEEELFAVIASMFIGENFGTQNTQYKMKPENVDIAFDFVNQHFIFFKFDEADISIDGICNTFKECVKKHGASGGLLDPFNCVEHLIPNGYTETQYIGEVLTKLITVAEVYGMHIFLVAHPTKLKKDATTGKYEVPNMYSISGSAHFYNKTDNGVVIYRNPDNTVDVMVQKVKWKFVGEIGSQKFNYDYWTGRYCEPDREYFLPYRYWLEYMQNGTAVPIEQPKYNPDEFIESNKELEEPLPF